MQELLEKQKSISGGVYCSKCQKCLVKPKNYKALVVERYEICATCNGEDFNENGFLLKHLGYNNWAILDHCDNVWCDSEFIHPRKASCEPTIFTFEQVKEFILKKYSCNLSS